MSAKHSPRFMGWFSDFVPSHMNWAHSGVQECLKNWLLLLEYLNMSNRQIVVDQASNEKMQAEYQIWWVLKAEQDSQLKTVNLNFWQRISLKRAIYALKLADIVFESSRENWLAHGHQQVWSVANWRWKPLIPSSCRKQPALVGGLNSERDKAKKGFHSQRVVVKCFVWEKLRYEVGKISCYAKEKVWSVSKHKCGF